MTATADCSHNTMRTTSEQQAVRRAVRLLPRAKRALDSHARNSQYDLARSLGVSQQTVCTYECDQRRVLILLPLSVQTRTATLNQLLNPEAPSPHPRKQRRQTLHRVAALTGQESTSHEEIRERVLASLEGRETNASCRSRRQILRAQQCAVSCKEQP